MKTSVLVLSFSLGFISLLFGQGDIFLSDKLEKQWETNGLEVPESVLPVPEKGILYVSNIAAKNSSTKEGAGFISILSTNGEIIDLAWASGLNSPKGMALINEKLFVTEVDRIAEIDIRSGEKIKDYPVEGAVFLNDIAADESGNLYISDSRTGTIYKMSDGKVTVFVKEEAFVNPNGVLIYDGKLVLGTGKNVVKINLKTKEINEFMASTGGVDGLAVLAPDLILFSDWPGKIHLMKKGEDKELILDTKNSETFKTADFGYIASEKLVFIPTFFRNSIICYKLKQ